MDRLVFKGVATIPIRGGATARIRVKKYADGDLVIIAAPGTGDPDEAPAMNAIWALKGWLGDTLGSDDVLMRQYEFEEESRIVQVPDALIVRGGADRVQEFLNVIARATVAPQV